MSQEKLTGFMAKAQRDKMLGADAKDAIENSEGPDKLVALGKKNGYDFIEKEVLQLVSKPASELSESELDAVAGGLFVAFVSKPRRWSLPLPTPPSPTPPSVAPGGHRRDDPNP